MKDKLIIKLKPCKYRRYSEEDKFDYCCRGFENCDGDIEPCDYCNTDIESQLLEEYNESSND